MPREGKFEAHNPRNPGNHIKSKVKFKILSIFMPFYGDDVRSGDGGGEHGG